MHTVFLFEGETYGMANHQSASSAGRIASTLIRFSLPLMLSGILQQLYQWADAFIVGNVEGEMALAAVGATTTVVNFYGNAITGFCVGLSILFAQSFGRNERAAIPKMLATFSLFLGGAFLLLAAGGIGLSDGLLRLMHTTPDTLALAVDYLRVVFIGIPFLAVYNVYAAALRGIGNSRAPFYSVLLSSIVNVLLDIVFVAFFRWSVVGAAAATVLSQAAMTLFLICYAVKKYPALRFRPSLQAFDLSIWKTGCRFGLPPMLQSSVSSAGSLILQNFMNGFGTQTVAAITTAYRVDSIIMVPLLNLGSGISTLVAQNKGAGQTKMAKKIFGVGTAVMAAVSLLLTALVIPSGGHLIALFGAGEQAIAIGARFFRYIASFYLIFGLATAVRSYLEGLGDVVYSSLAGIFSLLCRIAASYALAPFLGNQVIAIAEGISWVLLLLVYLARLVFRKKEAHL